MNPRTCIQHQQGVTLIELLVTMAITMFLIAAAAYVYLGTRETQRAIDRNSSNNETGTFVMQLIGQEIMKAGYYPANTSRPLTADESFPKISYYPPIKLAENAAQKTDWIPPVTKTAGVYLSGLFGCNGSKFEPATGECPAQDDAAPDSIVINYFTNDNLGASVGDRLDCTGGDIAKDPSNTNRLNNNTNAPPLQPLFVSNRFALNITRTEIDKQEVSTFSLACNGNGAATPTNNYQPLLQGIEDMQFTYGVFAVTADTGSRTPEKFYTAREVSSDLQSVNVDNGIISAPTPPWARISAVRVCILVKSLGGSPKIADKTGAERKYTDCKGVTKAQGASDGNLYRRFEQVFVLRNRMGVAY